MICPNPKCRHVLTLPTVFWTEGSDYRVVSSRSTCSGCQAEYIVMIKETKPCPAPDKIKINKHGG